VHDHLGTMLYDDECEISFSIVFDKENQLASIAHSVYDGIIDKRRKISG